MPHKLICGTCSTPFEAVRRDAQFCSQKCRDRARRGGSRKPPAGTIFTSAVTACLDRLPAMRGHGLALLALAVAERLDRAGSRDTAPLARELRAILADLRALAAAEPPQGGDAIDAILARRRLGPSG